MIVVTRRTVLTASAAVVAATLAGCNGTDPPAPTGVASQPPPPLRILALGDSLTWGWPKGPGTATSYQPYLGRLLNYAGIRHEILTRAIAGQTTADILPWAPDAVRETTPDVALVDVGQNDAGRLAAGFAERYTQLLDAIAATRPGVAILAAVIQGSLLTAQHKREQVVRDTIRQIAVPPRVAGLVDFSRLPADYLRGDLGHPTPAGYEARAYLWYLGLAEYLRLPRT